MDNAEAIEVLRSFRALAGRGLATTVDDVDARALDLAIEALRAPKYVAARMDSDRDPSIPFDYHYGK